MDAQTPLDTVAPLGKGQAGGGEGPLVLLRSQP